MGYEIAEVELIFDVLNDECERTVHAFTHELLSIRAGRASAHILEKVVVDYYGTMMPINQMANISTPEARLLVISVWDVGAVKSIEKAIVNANIGLTPNSDGKIIRLVFPELTEDRRKQLGKEVKALSEKIKIEVRNHRRDAMEELKKLKKDSIVTEDELATFEKDVEKAIAGVIERVDALTAKKEKELMEV